MVTVLLSGGIDSLVCAEMLRQSGELAGCVFVDYGHPAQVNEGWKAFAYCGSRGVNLKVVHVFGLDLGDMESASGARVVPCRNAILVSAAANAAKAMGATEIAIGCNAADQWDYTDCRPPFLESISGAVGLAVWAPLIEKTKPEIIGDAIRLGLTKDDSWSCYLGGPTECGECPSCVEAERAWNNG